MKERHTTTGTLGTSFLFLQHIQIRHNGLIVIVFLKHIRTHSDCVNISISKVSICAVQPP